MSGPTRPDKAFLIRDFTPGYLDSPESDTLPLGATPDAKNGFLYQIDVPRARAVLGRRMGTRLCFTTAVHSEKAWDGLFEWQHSGTQDLLGVCNGELFSIDTVGGAAPTSIGTGWTAGAAARMTPFRNDAFVYDGTYMRRWDGATLYEVGSGAPGTLANMTATAGPGVTGTYESLYTWYNANRDRHSSPSDITTAVAFANQTRNHTKPASAAPTWATHWGIWIRRTDTSELSFFHVMNVAIATGAQAETVSDTVRQRNEVAPLPSANDAPPDAWAILAEHKGYAIGILDGDDSFYVSKIGDAESWHPRDNFPVSRATGEFLCWAKQYGTEMLMGTSHRTWRLENEQVPFKPTPVKGRYGNVSQEACLEVDGRFYGWDRVHGPYVTDLIEWRALGRNRIDTLLSTINPTALTGIRAEHCEKYGLILWAVPTSGNSRKRTIIPYNYYLDCFYPPITGLEYASLASFQSSAGTAVYIGDYWGRVLELFSGSKEGVPTSSPTDNLRRGTVVSSTSSTVTVDNTTLNLYTTGSGLAGIPVAVKSAAGVWQWRICKSNTANQITIDTINGSAWDANPHAGDEFIVGGIEWYHWTPWIDFGLPHLAKRLQYLYVQARSTSEDHELDVTFRYNQDSGEVGAEQFAFDVALGAGLWDVGMWDVATFAESQRQVKKRSLTRSPTSIQIRFRNYYPDEEIQIPLYGLSADPLPGMQVPSV